MAWPDWFRPAYFTTDLRQVLCFNQKCPVRLEEVQPSTHQAEVSNLDTRNHSWIQPRFTGLFGCPACTSFERHHFTWYNYLNKLCARPPQYSRPVTLTFYLMTSKVVFESRVTWATSVPILVFLGLSVLDLGPMHATDRRQTTSSLKPPPRGRDGIINK